MATQVSKKITFNDPAPKNIQNAGIVRVENFNRVVEDITTLFNIDGYYYAGNTGTSKNIDWSDGVVQEVNLDNDPTITFSNGELGKIQTLLLKQQIAGTRTITWPNSVIWNNDVPVSLQNVSGASTVDTTFNTGVGFNNNVIYKTISVQTDGKIIAGGDFTSYDGSLINRIIRISSTGSIDSTFIVGSGFNNRVSQTIIQPDGKIIISGSFTTYNSITHNRIVRLNPDGSIDNTFVTGTGFGNIVSTNILQTDGSIYSTGQFTSYNGNSVNRIVKLNSVGGIDNTFNSGSGFNSTTLAAAQQSDGKIIIGGVFTSYNGVSVNRIVRLNIDGSLDTTFNVGTGFNNNVYDIAIQTNGKIVIAGAFTLYNGVLANRIVRLNTDGSIDSSFNTGSGLNDFAVPVKIQNDGKILVGGRFTSYNGVTSNKIVRINSDGSIDVTFTGTSGFNLDVDAITIQPDGKILVGGVFTSYNGVTHNRIVRLNGLVPTKYNVVTFIYNGANYIGSY